MAALRQIVDAGHRRYYILFTLQQLMHHHPAPAALGVSRISSFLNAFVDFSSFPVLPFKLFFQSLFLPFLSVFPLLFFPFSLLFFMSHLGVFNDV